MNRRERHSTSRRLAERVAQRGIRRSVCPTLPLFETPHFLHAADSPVQRAADELAKLYAWSRHGVIGVFPHAQHPKVILFIDSSNVQPVLQRTTYPLFKTFR